MGKSPAIPSLVKKKVFQECASTCAFCGEEDVAALEIHHVKSREEGGSSTYPNLILVCANCHSRITSGQITAVEVAKKKFMLMQHRLRPQPAQGGTTSVTVNDTVNSGIIAGNLTIKGAPRPKLMPTAGSIATDLARRNYILHLIKRYIEFKSADKTQGKFRPVIYNTIEKEFGATWDAVPLDRFEDLAAYLKSRIDKTIVGKRNARLNYKNYSGFEDPRWQGGAEK